jgi:hypothetical protein
MRRSSPSCHGGASSMLRLGLGSTPMLVDTLALTRFKVLQPRQVSTQLSLFQRPATPAARRFADR